MLERQEGKFWYHTIDDYLSSRGIETGNHPFVRDKVMDHSMCLDLEDGTISLRLSVELKEKVFKIENLRDIFLDGYSCLNLGRDNDYDIELDWGYEGDEIEIAHLNISIEGTPFTHYKENEIYPAGEFLQRVLDYFVEHFDPEKAKQLEGSEKDGRSVESDIEEYTPQPTPQPRQREEPGEGEVELRRLESKVDELLGYVRTHPIVMKDYDTYLKELYVDVINEDMNNLRSFEFDGHRVDYVMVESSTVKEQRGTWSGNLLFVAKDKGLEEWQEQVIAWHEYWHSQGDVHEMAKVKELDLVRGLGVDEEEYKIWREEIDNGF